MEKIQVPISQNVLAGGKFCWVQTIRQTNTTVQLLDLRNVSPHCKVSSENLNYIGNKKNPKKATQKDSSFECRQHTNSTATAHGHDVPYEINHAVGRLHREQTDQIEFTPSSGRKHYCLHNTLQGNTTAWRYTTHSIACIRHS